MVSTACIFNSRTILNVCMVKWKPYGFEHLANTYSHSKDKSFLSIGEYARKKCIELIQPPKHTSILWNCAEARQRQFTGHRNEMNGESKPPNMRLNCFHVATYQWLLPAYFYLHSFELDPDDLFECRHQEWKQQRLFLCILSAMLVLRSCPDHLWRHHSAKKKAQNE